MYTQKLWIGPIFSAQVQTFGKVFCLVVVFSMFGNVSVHDLGDQTNFKCFSNYDLF